jgi:hypothetical protein
MEELGCCTTHILMVTVNKQNIHTDDIMRGWTCNMEENKKM